MTSTQNTAHRRRTRGRPFGAALFFIEMQPLNRNPEFFSNNKVKLARIIYFDEKNEIRYWVKNVHTPPFNSAHLLMMGNNFPNTRCLSRYKNI